MTLFGFRRLTVDVGLVALCTGGQALRPFVCALQSLAFTVCGRALAFVRAQLSFVRQPLALIRDPVPLIGDPLSPSGLHLASSDLGLTPQQSVLALFEGGGPVLELIGHVGKIPGSHTDTLALRRPPCVREIRAWAVAEHGYAQDDPHPNCRNVIRERLPLTD